MLCHQPPCLSHQQRLCISKGYCKRFDLDGTPAGEGKTARNLARQADMEERYSEANMSEATEK